MTQPNIKDLKGLIATVVTSGHIDEAFAMSHENLRSYNDRNGWLNVEYAHFPAVLVEAGRDSAVEHALRNNYAWILQIDADAAPFPPNSLEHLLRRAYVEYPDADVIGGYCQLKGPPHLPTIDRGSGTWETIYPGEGMVPVIRTGGHFLFAKTPTFKKFGPPWFRSRLVQAPIKAFAEVDNFLRTQTKSQNPFAKSEEWKEAIRKAKLASVGASTTVGEDSGFSDEAKFANLMIYVDTDLVVGHVAKKTIMPDDLKEAMEDIAAARRLACGLL